METSPLSCANFSYVLGSVIMYIFEFYLLFFNELITWLSEGKRSFLLTSVSIVQTLQSLRDGKLLRTLSGLAPGSLPAQQDVLRALALLLTGEDDRVSEAVRLHLVAAARNEHFREKVTHELVAIKPKTCLIFCNLPLIFGHFYFIKIIHFCLLVIYTLQSDLNLKNILWWLSACESSPPDSTFNNLVYTSSRFFSKYMLTCVIIFS